MSGLDDTLARVVAELVAAGAESVVLTGSHARSEAGSHSDVDLLALMNDVGGRPAYELSRADEFLLSVSWRTPEQISATFRRPEEAGAAVPDWRGAVLLHDDGGAGTKLIEEAGRWTWEAVEPSCDRWVADEVTGYAEEVHKLIGALEAEQWEHAAVQRDALALRLPRIMSVQRRLVHRKSVV